MTVFVLMGVSGSGKTSVGERVARELGLAFVEGDDHHPAANVAKMASGVPLDDADRGAWLDALAAAVELAALPGPRGVVVACSALTGFARARLSGALAAPPVFVHLVGRREVIERRLELRRGHFMPASLLPSQLAALEPPDDALVVDAERPLDEVARDVAALVRARH